jgi:hypothetical protein
MNLEPVLLNVSLFWLLTTPHEFAHAWAATKMISDAVQNQYGMPMLMLDVDNTDFRYKSEKEIRTAVSEYMDTVVNKR